MTDKKVPAAPSDAEKDRTSAARFRQRMMVGPLVGFPLAFAGYLAASSKTGPIFFHWHPLLMMVAYVTVAGNAITMKKVGGYTNTWNHGALMFVASAFATAGAWVIYTNKENYKKAHLTTLHAQLGAVTLLALCYPIFSWVLYNPTNGVLRTHKTFRAIHKWVGRAVTVLSFVTIFTGLWQTEKDHVKAGVMIGSLGMTLPWLVL